MHDPSPETGAIDVRILFSGFQNGALLRVLETVLDRLQPSLVATIDEHECRVKGRTDVLHHDVWRLIDGDYDYRGATPAPLSEDLLLRMADCEDATLRMMDRLDRHRYRSYAARRALYRRHLRYWNDFLRRYPLDCVVLSNVPHEVYDFVLFHLCRLSGIRTLMFCQGPVPDRTFLTGDWRSLAAEVGERYQALLKAPPEAVKLAPEVERHFQDQAHAPQMPVPFFVGGNMSRLASEHTVSGFAARAIHNIRQIVARERLKGGPLTPARVFSMAGHLLDRFRARLGLLRDDRRLWRQYESLCKDVDLDVPFIFVPLHFQPEATTSPLAGVFVEQALIVQILAAAAPPGTLLYVKEHPAQRARGRDPGFYEELAAIPGVRFVRKTVPSSQLIARARAVATATGTAGWEALFRGKPVLMFGDFFYASAPGVHRVRDLAQCQQAFRAIEAGAAPDLRQMRCFLRAVQDRSVNGYSDLLYREVSQLSEAANVANLTTALVERLKPA